MDGGRGYLHTSERTSSHEGAGTDMGARLHDAEYFTPLCNENHQNLRLLKYPSCKRDLVKVAPLPSALQPNGCRPISSIFRKLQVSYFSCDHRNQTQETLLPVHFCVRSLASLRSVPLGHAMPMNDLECPRC
eukprot:1362594-Rhodomonas_salina.3